MPTLGKLDRTLLQKVQQNGGSLTIDQNDRSHRDVWARLRHLAEMGHLEEGYEGALIIYTLVPDDRPFHRGQRVIWMTKPPTEGRVIRMAGTRVEILTRTADGEAEIHKVDPTSLQLIKE